MWRDRRGSFCTVIEGNLWDALAIFRKGLDHFTEGNIEGLQSFFIEGSLLKRPIFEGHDCISEETSEVTLEVRVWKSMFDSS